MIPDLPTLGFFALATLLLLVVPGPVVIFVVARSLDQGRLAGIVSVLGVHLGSIVHVVAAAIGLSALLASSAEAFTVMKILGAGYLVYLGAQRLLEKDRTLDLGTLHRQPLKRLFWQGCIVNILNPKTALFFLAFLPQFVDPGRGAVAWQIVFLGSVFIVLGLVSDALYALLAGSLRVWVALRPKALRVERYVSAATYLGLGIITALAQRS